MINRRILTLGSFDLLHDGHVGFLQKCRRLAGTGGHLTVAVNSDEFMVSYKREPIWSLEQRMQALHDLHIADEIIENIGFMNQPGTILAADPDVVAIAVDWAFKDYAAQLCIPNLDWFTENDMLLVYLPRTGDISTTQLIESGLT